MNDESSETRYARARISGDSLKSAKTRWTEWWSEVNSPAGVPLDQLIEDRDVSLPPCGCGVRHEPDCVTRFDEVEPVPAGHRWITSIVPMRVGAAVTIPVVGSMGLAVEISQPAERTSRKLRRLVVVSQEVTFARNCHLAGSRLLSCLTTIVTNRRRIVTTTIKIVKGSRRTFADACVRTLRGAVVPTPGSSRPSRGSGT